MTAQLVLLCLYRNKIGLPNTKQIFICPKDIDGCLNFKMVPHGHFLFVQKIMHNYQNLRSDYRNHLQKPLKVITVNTFASLYQ